MFTPEPLSPNIPNARRLARKFTPHTPFYHPHLDPNLPKKDLPLVPPALFPGRNLNWELPQPAATNLHITLKLTNDPNELRKEFHDKVPQIDEVLGMWGELKGVGQKKLRTPIAEDQGWNSTEEGKENILNLVSNLDTPGRADVIYLTDAVEDGNEHAEDSSIPPNLRTIEWLGFDGSYIHLEDEKPKMAAFPTEQVLDFDEPSMRSSAPSNLRVTEWLDDEQYSNETCVSEPGSASKEVGPYETFWINHGPDRHTDEGDAGSSKFQ